MSGGGLEAKAASWARESRTVINGVEFQFRKLLAMDAYDILEDIRVSVNGQVIATAMASMDAGGGVTPQKIGMAFAALPRVIGKTELARIRAKLFTCVDFRLQDAKRDSMAPIISDLTNDEPKAFGAAGPLAVYQVLARSLAVNFTEHFSDLLSALDLGAEDTPATPIQH